jgi:hypothetical protein
LNAVEAADERLFRSGAKRVDFVLWEDDRRDKARIMEDKVRSLRPRGGRTHFGKGQYPFYSARLIWAKVVAS